MVDVGQLRPLGVGEILDASIRIYRSRFLTLLKAVAVVVAPVQVLNLVILLSLPSSTTTTRSFSGGTYTTTTGPNPGAAFAAVALIAIVGLVSAALAQAVSLKVITDAYLGTETGWRESLRFGLRKLASVLWVSIMHTLGLVVAFLACIVPGIWLYAAWSVAIPALLVEQTKGRRALGRSFNLVSGRWWPTAGVLILAFLLTSIVTFAFSILLIPLLMTGASATTTQTANAIASGIASVLTTPFAAAVAAVLYFDLRVRKEGFDLALLAQRIGVEAPPGGFRPAAMPWSPATPGWSPPPPGWAPPPPPGSSPPPPPGWDPPDAPAPPGAPGA